jgi:hypothetical protein
VVGKARELLLDVYPSLSRQTRGRCVALCRSAVTPGAIPYQRVVGVSCKRRSDEGRYCQCHYFYGDGVHRENSMPIRQLQRREAKWNQSFQMAKVGRDSFDLRSGQAMRNRGHNG